MEIFHYLILNLQFSLIRDSDENSASTSFAEKQMFLPNIEQLALTSLTLSQKEKMAAQLYMQNDFSSRSTASEMFVGTFLVEVEVL